MCYRTPDCGQRRNRRLTSGNLAPQDVDNGRCPIGENFLYVFKGARSAPRAWRRVTAHAATAGELAHQQKAGATRPRGTRRTTRRPLALARKRTAAAAEARTPGSSPHRLGAATRRACANGAILPARPLLKPSKITVKAVCDRRPTGNGQDDQVHVHAKTTLTVIFHRFDSGAGRKDGQDRTLPLQV